MKRRRVLLLNPPGFQIYVRDYYCSKISKARYLYHPLDLLMMTGTLSRYHDIRVIDGMTDGWTHHGVAKAVRSFQPEVIIFLTGVVSFREDMQFIQELRNMVTFVAIASGEMFLDDPVKTLETIQEVDAAVLDFTDTAILELIDRLDKPGEFSDGSPIRNIVYRANGSVTGTDRIKARNETFEIDVPRHDLFPNEKYRYPFVRGFPFATVLTDFGCPYKCEFCAINQLGHKKRSVENVLEELDFIHRLGFRDIYFDDQTFGADRKRAETLLNAMIERDYGMGFICFTRADKVDRDLLKLMKSAGCHTVVFGVEASANKSLSESRKDMTIEAVRQSIGWCRLFGIRTVGTFIVGLPGMTESQAADIGTFAACLGLDFASFNVPAPRPGTELRKRALQNGWIDENVMEMDQSGSYAVMGNEYMTADQVDMYRKKASRQFYFRLGYLWRRLIGIRSWYELKTHFYEGTDLLLPSKFVEKH